MRAKARAPPWTVKAASPRLARQPTLAPGWMAGSRSRCGTASRRPWRSRVWLCSRGRFCRWPRCKSVGVCVSVLHFLSLFACVCFFLCDSKSQSTRWRVDRVKNEENKKGVLRLRLSSFQDDASCVKHTVRSSETLRQKVSVSHNHRPHTHTHTYIHTVTNHAERHLCPRRAGRDRRGPGESTRHWRWSTRAMLKYSRAPPPSFPPAATQLQTSR